jgi:hypothetical protein
MSKNVLIEGFYINDSNQEWIDFELVFDVDKFAKLLVEHKDVFEHNKGKAKISLCRSKNNKRYASLSTWKNSIKPEITTQNHLPDRELADSPF